MTRTPGRVIAAASMIRALFLSIGQLGDRRILAVFAQSLGVTLLLFAVLGAGVWWGLAGWMEDWLGERDMALAGFLAVAATVLGFWLLFRAISVAVLWLFGDRIVAAVERRHYPAALARARSVPLVQASAMALTSALRVTAVNLVLIPVYLALLVTGVGTAALFFVVNAWLLGRDLGDMVASRHLGWRAMRDWRRGTGPARFGLGLIATGLFLVPVLFILAPYLGAAMATHLYHRTQS